MVGAVVLLLVMAVGATPRLLSWDKAEHFIGFYVLTFLSIVAFPRASMSMVAGVLLLFAAAIEFAQLFTSRSTDLRDWIASALGVAAVYAPLMLPMLREGLAKSLTRQWPDALKKIRALRAPLN